MARFTTLMIIVYLTQNFNSIFFLNNSVENIIEFYIKFQNINHKIIHIN